MSPYLLALAVAVGAPPAKDLPKKDDPLVGRWALESVTVRGTSTPGHTVTVTFAKGGTCSTEFDGRVASSTYTHDPTRSPAHLDVPESHDGAIRTSHRLYRIDQDTLTICWAVDGARPIRFDAPAGSDRVLMVYRRAKQKE